MRFVLLLSLILAPCCARAGDVQRVAVLELRDQAGLAPQEAQYLADIVRSQAAARLSREAWLVMTRESLLALLPPGTDLGACVGDCEVETGRNLGAHYVVSGEVVRFGESGGLRVVLKLHETAGGALLATGRASGDTVDALEPGVESAARDLFAGLASPAAEPGFAAGLSALEEPPALARIELAAPAGTFGDLDVELLERLQAARDAERDETREPRKRAEAWDAVAERASGTALGALAQQRSAEWIAHAEAAEGRRARIDAARARYKDDQARLAKLLALDDEIAPPERKAEWRRAFDQAYDPWRTVFGEEARKACAAQAEEAADGWMFALIDLIPYYREALLFARHLDGIGVEFGWWSGLALAAEATAIAGLVVAASNEQGTAARTLGWQIALGGYLALPIIDFTFAELTLEDDRVRRCEQSWLGACRAPAAPRAFGLTLGGAFE